MHEIRPYQSKDRERLRTLIGEVWPARPPEVFDSRWWWQFDPAPLFVSEDKETGAIVGVCACIRFLVYSGKQTMEGAWLVDLFVSNTYQGRGLGKSRKGSGRLLSRAVMETSQITASLSQTNAAWRTLHRIGWRERNSASLYLNPLGLIPGAIPLIRTFVPDDPALRMELGGMPADADGISQLNDLWRRLKDRFDVLAVRDAERLRVRFAPREGRCYQMMRAYRNGSLCGYMVFRVCPPNSLRSLKRYPMGRHPLSLIVDYLVDPDEPRTFGTLLNEATRLTMSQGAKSLLCLATVPAFQSELTKRGFMGAGSPLVGRRLSAMDVGFTCYSAPGQPDLSGCKWFLTLADCDLDLTWGESPV
jgi:hypothetical protein